ncbi:(2Fe-2S)-binding protein [Massilia violaceinigra]|uniref:(2Fe-2S)-binding protein n=1 Tax=Massilia violaceinigra TaxID=2045208 RepID=A0ABY4AA34_9BURK|nr:2Fe-2S iron-sulfur cluster-binding protein [Massilia violaceinigra]UOD30539.1 (2Fe-2S)-binding protein [Massilia violaceinigra]
MAGDQIVVQVDGRPVTVAEGASVVAALVLADALCTRRSVSGEARFALCGMGYCQECRVSIDGRAHRLACQTTCRAGMLIATGAGEAA